VAGLVLLVAASTWAAVAGLRQGDAPPEAAPPGPEPQDAVYTGSSTCRECHPGFHELWADSHHGTAMQPYTAELAAEILAPQEQDIVVAGLAYRAEIGPRQGWVVERGPDEERRYPIAHVLGGKNVCYFLTPLDRGRLQTLPVAFDLRRGEWYDTAASGLRHFEGVPEEAVHWKDVPYTFNTSCHACHVSQLEVNYDREADAYRTTWAEPGINCETCHGPAGEHVRVCREAPEGQPPEDLRIILTSAFDVQQTNALCAPCHAKMSPLTEGYPPGERFFDHFGLSALEHPDFHPDGRDLGENYTWTAWLMNPCARSGQLDCLHCHTSSGRWRHADDPNRSCLPCHRGRVENAAAHSRHPEGSEGSLCISCHMPATDFARMRRSDHSMLPPTPAATEAFGSPNACSPCHSDRDAAWADAAVREWHGDDGQAAVLHRAGLVDAARRGEWRELDAMLAYLRDDGRDEVFAASLIRLLESCEDPRAGAAIVERLRADPSPLVRGSAAMAAATHLTPEAVDALLAATRDEFRLVRVRAAAGLAPLDPQWVEGGARADLERAVAEFLVAMGARPDDSASQYNLGNFHLARGENERAAACFEEAFRLDPFRIAPLVNASLAYSGLGRGEEAEACLRRALERDPRSVAASFNLGLLLAELGRLPEAEAAHRETLRLDPEWAPSAYNLGVLLASDRMEEALFWCRRASELRPSEARYAYTLAFYQRQSGDAQGAAATLQQRVAERTANAESYYLLGEILVEADRRSEALEVYRQGQANAELAEEHRRQLAALARSLSSR